MRDWMRSWTGLSNVCRFPVSWDRRKENAPYGEGPKKALDYALQLGKDLGLRVKNVDNKAGWVEIGEGEEMVGILGHLDVVPVGEGWDYPGLTALWWMAGFTAAEFWTIKDQPLVQSMD